MKKLVTLMSVIAFFAFLDNPVFAAASSKAGPYDEEVAIRDATDPADPRQERSLLPSCQAYVGNQVEILFNKYIGEVSVAIVNKMGTIISSATCNSEFEYSVYLQKPVGSGVYFIYILGSTGYQGTGEFTIE
ncbi:MAG: hypothetical protein RR555_02485 [Bacteroidales bacterium]